MHSRSLTLTVQPEILAVCRLEPTQSLPDWALQGFFSMTRSPTELSIVCVQTQVPSEIQAETDWRCLRVEGVLDFSLTGILAALATPLAEAGISIFALSTYDTDYLLVKQDQLTRAIETLKQAGFEVMG
ncbi:MAG: ACT domain-containing protein [Oculatellaceae cyanobacterium Prado106]|jgi:hypothetical protein|nr:ACT domain-containing protein [Oculatellaceae cyanobacterium Prado106]